MSKPLQVYLEERDLKDLEAWAKERGWTKSQAIRTAVRALVRPDAEDPILGLSGILHGLPPDVSENFNKYFAETFVSERAAPYRAQRRRPRKTVRR
jgi:hypothetical protein